jgi:hypothetical protein
MSWRASFASVVLAAVVAAPAAAAEQKATGDGIRVHGDWTIQIRNPDGSLASRYEFTNALVPGQGDLLLARLLGRTSTAFTWRVDIGDGTVAGGPCLPPTTPPLALPCFVGEPALTVTVTPWGTVELSGSVTADRTASVARVTTTVTALATGEDHFAEVLSFSQKQLPSSIPVIQGQIIQVKVVFSFS